MSNLKFTETHNLVAFLEKPKESDGFEGIINFFNVSSIRYALTVNPTIYTSCIKQFWATAKAKTVNGEVQIQALVDGKKVIVTETSVRRALQLKDAEGTECLPNATIFAELERMSAMTTTWNKISSTIASAIICLATNQKFNFSKYIFNNMVKSLKGGVKFQMYLRFVQLFLDRQVKGITKHKEIYVTPSHTKKVFANIKREGKGFSGRVTPLFQTMMVQAPKELGEGSEIPTDPQHTPTIIQPSTSQPQKKQPRRKQRKDTKVPQPSGSTEPITDEAANEEHVPIHSNDPLLSGEDRLKLNELMELCTNLSQRVLDLENTKTSQAAEIAKLKERVKKLERRNKSRTLGLKRLRKVGRTARIESSKDEGLGAQEDASKQGRKITDLDADAEVTLVDEAQGRIDDNLMFDTGVFDEQEVEVEKVVSTAEVTTASATTTTVDELTLAQTLIEIKAAKPKAVTTAATTTTTAVTRPKARGVVVQEPSEFRTTTSSSQTSQLPQAKDKGKAKMVEPEKPLKKKDQILVDEEIAQRLQEELQAELEEEERLARQKEEEDNLISWDNTQAMMEADYELAQRLQAEEQGELTIEERSKLFVELMDKRKKHFAKLRAEEIRRKPPTKAQKRNQMKDGIHSNHQLQNIDKEDLETLYKLVKAKHGNTRPEEAYERVSWGDLKVMFEPDVEKMDFRSFMVEGVNGEFHFLPEGGANDEGSSPSTKFVNNEALVIDVEPLTAVHPSEFAENISDSDNAPSKKDEITFVGRFVDGKAQTQKVGVSSKASKASGDASNPLDVDSDPDIHEFPSAKEIKDYADCHWVVTHMIPPSWKQHLKELSLEKLCDIYGKAYMRQAVLDNMLNSRTRNLMSTLSKARASCDAIRERKGKVDKLHGMYRRLVLEEKKLITYKQILSILYSKVKGLESKRERLKSSETQLLQEIDRLRQDKAVVVSKVVPHMAMKLFRSDEMVPVIRMASTAAKPCQEDSSEFYLITGSIYTNQQGTMIIATVFDGVTKILSSISVDYH
ncbi:hypothetical protein Tco_0392964 [Tanacetum coccineum]